MVRRLFLVHWNEPEAAELAGELAAMGWTVECEASDGERAAHRILENPPQVAVFSLRRLPSHGRQTAAWLRDRLLRDELPIVFVDGAPDKVERVRDAVPDAFYTTWDELPAVLEEVMT